MESNVLINFENYLKLLSIIYENTLNNHQQMALNLKPNYFTISNELRL